MSQQAKIIIITGPCGVGKTTVSEGLSKKLGIHRLSGDDIKDQWFPEVSDITLFPEKLEKVKEGIFLNAQKYYHKGESLLIDYVITGEVQIKRYQDAFNQDLIFKVLFPSKSVIYQRDQERDCWTTGEVIIDHLYQSYSGLVDVIGKENYLDTSGQEPFETIEFLASLLELELISSNS